MIAIYLRKSRLDLDAERSENGNTLARHKTVLLDYAKKHKLKIGKIYEEVRSGDSISARPMMQQLLHDVEAGQWEAVLVMEIERLARGDSIDQGIVAQAFKYSGTKIITPMKTYDPQNEFDEEFFEFGLFMSRREYKTIKRRLAAGRVAAVREGKYLGKVDPIGYRRVRVENGKGWTLEIVPEQAEIVQRIFHMAANGTGLQKIARILNAEHIPTANGNTWSEYTVRSILENVIYRGDVSYGRRPAVKKSSGRTVEQSRSIAKNYLICEGLHEPIVSKDLFDKAKFRRKRTPAPPVRLDTELKNPFQGILYCRKCGRKLQLVSRAGTDIQRIVCRNITCDNVSARLEVVEASVMQALMRWTKDYTVNLQGVSTDDLTQQLQTLTAAYDGLCEESNGLKARMEKVYELLELGVYTTEEFIARRAEIEAKISDLNQSIEANKDAQEKARKAVAARETIAPRMIHIVETWNALPNAQEKNNLLRASVDRIEYLKSGNYSTSDINIWIFPILEEK